jgi:hypothetical protein
VPPDPSELLLRADVSARNPTATQVDLRRAISDAYYAVFHSCLIAAADMICGAASRTSDRYRLVYRSVDHGTLAKLCKQVSQTNPVVAIKPSAGFGQIADFARVAGSLQGQRHLADYDPSPTFTGVEALIAISDARQAICWFTSSTNEQKEAFLWMLLFRQR